MTTRELHTQLQSAQPPTLLHVLPAEVFAATRLPGSRNACVYETAFLDHITALALDPSASIVVYGAGEGSRGAATAAEKLRAAGFTYVETFDGGLEWTAAGLPLEGTGLLPQPPVPDGTYRLDTAESVIRWTGRNLFNHHSGTVRLAGGEIRVNQGQLASARFTIDMASIACEDLADPALNAMLLAHLRTADFFNVEHHPAAEFVATTAERIETCTDGTPNHLLRGTFTLRGISRPLEFPVLIAAKDDGSTSPARQFCRSIAPPTAATTAPANSSLPRPTRRQRPHPSPCEGSGGSERRLSSLVHPTCPTPVNLSSTSLPRRPPASIKSATPLMAKESKDLTFDEFADELLAETQPRALMILASAKIDIQLRSLIEVFFLPKNRKAKEPDELLDGENPPATISSRIKICHRAGLIDDRLSDALDKLRGLRNQAAHWVSFGIADAPLKDQLKHLHVLMASRRSYKLTVSRFFGETLLTPHQQLQATLLTLAVLLESIRSQIESKARRRVSQPTEID